MRMNFYEEDEFFKTWGEWKLERKRMNYLKEDETLPWILLESRAEKKEAIGN
jgi:hypothetical protein